MSRINPAKQVKLGVEQNQILVTDGTGELVFLSAPTANSQVLMRIAGVLGWGTITGSSYIGDATSHTAGGSLDMDSFDISNVGNVITQVLSFTDVGGDMASWSMEENGTEQLICQYNGTTRLTLSSNGAARLNTYGSGTFTGTAVYYLCVDSSGNIIEVAV
jgi:hypothetical protein